MASWMQSWKNAEGRIFGWMQNLLSGDLDKSAFIGELPKDFEYATETGMWVFELMGGGGVLDEGQNVSDPGGWGEAMFDGEVRGIWSSRDEAREKAGALMDNLPIGDGVIDGIYRITLREYPRVERQVIGRKADQAQGGEMRVWAMTLPVSVIFQQTEV